jgi:hypothetical protein
MKTYVNLYMAEFCLEWEMFQTKAVERISTHIMFNKIFPQICAVYEIMWRNMLQPDRAQVAI